MDYPLPGDSSHLVLVRCVEWGGGQTAKPGGLVFKAHRLLYHSTLGLREIKKKKKKRLDWRERVATLSSASVPTDPSTLESERLESGGQVYGRVLVLNLIEQTGASSSSSLLSLQVLEGP